MVMGCSGEEFWEATPWTSTSTVIVSKSLWSLCFDLLGGGELLACCCCCGVRTMDVSISWSGWVSWLQGCDARFIVWSGWGGCLETTREAGALVAWLRFDLGRAFGGFCAAEVC